MALFHTSIAVTIGLLPDTHCICLSIIEVAFESSPAVLITFFQLCALQSMLHDPRNVIDLQGATQTSSAGNFYFISALNVLGLHKVSFSCNFECSHESTLEIGTVPSTKTSGGGSS